MPIHLAFRICWRGTRGHSKCLEGRSFFWTLSIFLLCSFWLAGCVPIPINQSRPLPEWTIMMIPDDLRSTRSTVLVLSQFTVDKSDQFGVSESIVVKLQFLKGTELVALPRILDVQSRHEMVALAGAAAGVIPLVHGSTFERLATLCIVAVDGRWTALDFSAWRRIRVGDVAEVYAAAGQLSADQRMSLLTTLSMTDGLALEQSYTPCAVYGEAKWNSDARAKAMEFFSLEKK